MAHREVNSQKKDIAHPWLFFIIVSVLNKVTQTYMLSITFFSK